MEPRLTEFEDLPHAARVWDVGGFEGSWAKDMAAKHDCTIRVFEPVPAFANQLKNEGFNVSEYGLSDHDHEAEIIVQGDRSSTFKESLSATMTDGTVDLSGLSVKARFRDISIVLDTNHLDVLKLNVEGAEYAILDRLISTGQIKHIRNLVVQFHKFVPAFGERYLAIAKPLRLTHTLRWRDPFVWEAWTIST
jgi:FkbM family methyltransferase